MYRVFLTLTVALFPTSVSSLLGQDVARHEGGAPAKIIVREPAALYSEPDHTAPNRPVDVFQWFYVLQREGQAEDDGGFYWVSASHSSEDALGYVPSDCCVVWPSRQAVSFVNDPKRELTQFYESREGVEGVYSAQGTAEPISEEPSGVPDGRIVLPLLSASESGMAAGRLYEVAYLHAAEQANGKLDAQTKLARARVQVAFVIDSTASMQEYIESVLRVVELVVKAVSSDDDPEIEFACVSYRDFIARTDENWYVTKVVSDFTRNHEEFLGRLRQVTAAMIGSEETAEAGCEGLATALGELSWDHSCFKHAIVLGDSSWHTDGPKNPNKHTLQQLIVKAQPRGQERLPTVLHALRVVGNDPSDYARLTSQFQQLAQGTEPSNKGVYAEFDGQGEADRFVQDVSQMILSARAGLSQAQQGHEPDPNTTGYGVVLRMLRAAQGVDDAVPTFAAGWAAEYDPTGRQQFHVLTLLRRDRAEMFCAGIDFICRALEMHRGGGPEKLADLVNKMQYFAGMTHLGEPIKANTPLHELMSGVLSIPVQSEIFDVTLNVLQSMQDADYESWVARMKECHGVMRQVLDDQQLWFSLEASVPPERHLAYVRVSDLP